MSDSPLKQNKIVSLDSLIAHPRNYRAHPQFQIDRLVLSLQRFGQGRSIVIQDSPEHPIIVAGHGIVEAARALKWRELRADILPADWTPEQVEGYLVADNLHADGASDNEELLAMLLQEQQDAGFDLASVGSDDETLRQMLQEMGDEYLAGDTVGDEEYSDIEEDMSAPNSLYTKDVIAVEAFKYFRNTGFPYRKLPLYLCMQELNKLHSLEGNALLHSKLGYHIADTYHSHRFHAAAERMKSPLEAFHDDKLLARVFQLFQESEKGVIPADIVALLGRVSGTQSCVNFRPAFALHLYRKYCKPGAVVLDTSTGYGGRLVGFIASGLAGLYIGIDPNAETHRANLKMAEDLQFSHNVELHNLPAEDVSLDLVRNRCDFAFTSPPYFAKEHYSDEETQSWKRYSTGDAWRTGFLQKMLALQYAALKAGAYAIINIADVKLRNRMYPLAHWTIEDGKAAGFEYLETLEFSLTHRFGVEDEEPAEPVIVFRKSAEVAHA